MNRGQNIGNVIGLQPDFEVDYVSPSKADKNIIYLGGTWKSNPDDLEAINNGEITLDFSAGSVNIVAENLNDVVTMEVFLDGDYISSDLAGKDVSFDEEKAFVVVDQPRLYNVFNGKYGNHVLRLSVEKGFTFNAFTFG